MLALGERVACLVLRRSRSLSVISELLGLLVVPGGPSPHRSLGNPGNLGNDQPCHESSLLSQIRFLLGNPPAANKRGRTQSGYNRSLS